MGGQICLLASLLVQEGNVDYHWHSSSTLSFIGRIVGDRIHRNEIPQLEGLTFPRA